MNPHLAHVRHVEDAYGLPDGRVLGDNSAVLDGHVPAAEVRGLGTGRDVTFV